MKQDEMKSTYFAESQKRYNDKCVKFTIKYTLNECQISEIVKTAIVKSGETPNKWIKQAIYEKLKNEGYVE